MKLKVLLSYLQLNSTCPDKLLNKVCVDSRQVKENDLFIAIPGIKTDGRKYIQQAIAQGAAVVLAEGEPGIEVNKLIPIFYIPELTKKAGEIISFFYGNPSKKLNVIGVTGTNGKTSVCHYVSNVLDKFSKPCGIIGTIGMGLPGNLSTTLHTTPDQVALQAGLEHFHRQKIEHVALEVSSHGLSQHRVDGVEFDTVVFTNLTEDHADYHPSKLEYWQEKLKLFLKYKYKHAVVNLDDPFGRQLISLLPKGVKVTGYSLIAERKAEFDIITASEIEFGSTSINAKINSRHGNGKLQLNLLGEGSLYNILAAIAVCLEYGCKFTDILMAANKLIAPKGRMELIYSDNLKSPTVVVDYAHTPAALSQALSVLRKHCNGKLYCVFGCGGDRDREKRPLMFVEALKYSDQAILTQDNSRTEKPLNIIKDMLEGDIDYIDELNNIDMIENESNKKVLIKLDRESAIKFAINAASENDIILIAGKGHEDYQVTSNNIIPFSDIAVAEKALKVGNN